MSKANAPPPTDQLRQLAKQIGDDLHAAFCLRHRDARLHRRVETLILAVLVRETGAAQPATFYFCHNCEQRLFDRQAIANHSKQGHAVYEHFIGRQQGEEHTDGR